MVAPTLFFWVAVLGADESFSVAGRLESAAIMLTGPSRHSISEPVPLRVVVTRPKEMEFETPEFESAPSDGTVVSMSSFGPDETGPFLSEGWVILIKPNERGAMALPNIRFKKRGEQSEAGSVVLAVPTIEIVDSAAATWESLGTFFLWAGGAGLLLLLVGGALSLARSSRTGEA